MTDNIQHKCGIAMIRLLKPLDYYREKYGTWAYGLQKLYLLMEKQHNRGQDGAGVVSLKFGLPPGQSYLDRHRSNNANPIKRIFDLINRDIHAFADHPKFQDTEFARQNIPFIGDIYLGHLRYGTFGKNSKHYLH